MPVTVLLRAIFIIPIIELRARKKTYPASRLHRDYLLSGILHCACGNKWGARTQKTRKNRKGVLVERKTLTGIYFCRQNHKDLVSPDCPRHIGAKKADAEAWQKICDAVDKRNTCFHKLGILLNNFGPMRLIFMKKKAESKKSFRGLTRIVSG